MIAVLRDDRVQPSATGEYSFDTELDDGTLRQESGSPNEEGAVVQTGSWS